MRNVKKFKGWTIPGPFISVATELKVGTEVQVAEVNEPVTLDALSGHFRIHQLKNGHRFSTDDLLVAWYGTAHSASVARALDLGSGLGSVGMIVAWRLPGVQMVTIEAQEVSVRLARASAVLNDLPSRYEIRQGDFRDPALLGQEEQFDLITGSPPYFALDAGILSEHPQKIACRFEARGTVIDYCSVAAAHLAPGGMFACVFPVAPAYQLERVLAGAREAGLCVTRWRPVVMKEGEPPLLGVFIMQRCDDLPTEFHSTAWQEPDLLIRMKDGTISPEYSRVKMSIGFRP